MKRCRRWYSTIGLVILIMAIYPPAASAADKSACDESCLKQTMDLYVDALNRGKPNGLPLDRRVRFTENGVSLELGDALWATVKSAGEGYRHYFYDVSAGGVALYTTFNENGRPGLISIRLAVRNRKITEIETVLNRDNARATRLRDYEPLWDEISPASVLLSRQELIKVAVDYLRSVVFMDGKLAPYAESCVRIENGGITALGPNDKPPEPFAPVTDPDSLGAVMRGTMGMGCGGQLNTGVYSFITEYDNWRFPIVDVSRQIVYGYFNFRRSGTITTITGPNGKTYPTGTSAQYPNEVLNTEAWKIRNGKITRVEAVFVGQRPYKLGTGWPGSKGERRELGNR